MRTMKVWLGCLLASGIAFAQPAPPERPLESQRPQGFSPAPPQGTQPVRPATGGGLKSAPTRDPEWLIARNGSDMSAWVTVYNGSSIEKAECVPAKGEARFAVTDPRATFRVKGELTRDAACGQPVVCMAMFDRRPGMASLDLRGGPGNCGWSPGGRSNLKAITSCCRVENPTQYSMWVTVYEGVIRKIRRTACVQPGKSEWVWMDQVAWVRAEITGRPNCGSVSRPPCDTTMNVNENWMSGARDDIVTIKPDNWAPGGGCWWESRCAIRGGCKGNSR